MAGIPRLFKTPLHKRFEYKPLYYDADKEELQERIQAIEVEMGIKKENYTPTIAKGRIRRQMTKNRKLQKQSNIRLLIILAFLAAIVYFVLYYNPQ